MSVVQGEDSLAALLREYAGLEGLGRTGRVIRELVAEIRKERAITDSLGEAATKTIEMGAVEPPCDDLCGALEAWRNDAVARALADQRCAVCAGLAMPMPGHIAEKARAVIESARKFEYSSSVHGRVLSDALDAYDQAVADDAKALLERGMGGG